MKPILYIPLVDKTITTPVPTPHVQYHPTGNAFIENNIPLVSPQYDADVKTGRALELGATNDLPIPTHVDGYITYPNLDTDTITQEATDGTDKVFNTITVNNILTHQMPFSAGDLTLIQQEPNILAALALGELTPISSVTLDADDSWYACSEVSGAYVVDQRAGYGIEWWGNPVAVEGAGWTDNLDMTYTCDGNLGNVEKRDVSVIGGTVYLVSVTTIGTYTTGLYFRLGGTGEPVRYLVGDGTHNLIIKPLTTGFARFRNNGTNQFVGTLSSVSIREATASEIADYNENIRLTNQQKGLQTTALLLDNAGVPESYNSTPNTARVYDDTIISTGFKPSIARYSIEESVSGNLAVLDVNGDPTGSFTQRTEKRLLTHRAISYGIDLFEGHGSFDAQADYDAFTKQGYTWEWTGSSASRTSGAVSSQFYRFVTLVVGETYSVSCDTTFTSGEAHWWSAAVDTGVSIEEEFQFEAGSAGVNLGITTTDGIFVFDNLTIRRVVPETKYYIDDVEQTTVPPLPDPNTIINLGNTAVIGYADTIESREADFNIHSVVITS